VAEPVTAQWLRRLREPDAAGFAARLFAAGDTVALDDGLAALSR